MGSIILLGVIIGMIYFEITEWSPGGMVVPGIIVYYWSQPQRIIFTLLIGVVTAYLIKFISRYLIVYGKRKFTVTIFVSIVLSYLFGIIFGLTSLEILNVTVVGYVISGLIAVDINKQGVKKTFISLAIVVGILKLALIVIG